MATSRARTGSQRDGREAALAAAAHVPFGVYLSIRQRVLEHQCSAIKSEISRKEDDLAEVRRMRASLETK